MKALPIAVIMTVVGWFSLPVIELRIALRGGGDGPAQPSVIMLGDSHTDFVNWGVLLRCKGKVANFGIGGNTTSQMLARLPQALALNPQIVVVMGGTNDALQNISRDVTVTNLRRMEELTEAAGIRFISLTPPPISESPVDVGEMPVPFTVDDLLPDQIHLRASGYAKWRDVIAPIVRPYC